MKKNSILYSIGASFYAGINIILVPLYANKLLLSEYGKLTLYFTTVNLLITLLGFSIQNSVIRYFYKGNQSFNKEKIFISVLFYCFILLVVFLSVSLLLQFLFLLTPETLILVLCSAIWIPSRIGIQSYLGLYRVTENVKFYLFISLSEIILILFLLFSVIILDKLSLGSVSIIYAFASLVILVICAIKEHNFRFKGLDHKFIGFVKFYGLPLSLANLASYILNYGNRYLLALYSGANDVGLYDISHKITSILSLIVVSGFTLAFTPYYLKIYYVDEYSLFKRKINFLVDSFSYIYLILSVLILFFDQFILDFLLNDEYSNASSITMYIFLGQYFYALFMIQTLSINILKNTKIELYITLISLVCGTLISYFLVRIYGLTGAAIGFSINSFICLSLMLIYNSKKFPLNPNLIKYSLIIIGFIWIGLFENQIALQIKLIVGTIFLILLCASLYKLYKYEL